MPTDTSICNRALQHIGTRTSIASLSEDSTEAKQCNLVYADTRDEVLSMAFWNFARKTATLSLLKSAPGTPTNPEGATSWSSAFPAPPWLYEYVYPSDCLQVRFIVPQSNTGFVGVPLFSTTLGMYPSVASLPQKFIVASDTDADGNDVNVILTNTYQAIGVYTRRVTNPQLFSSQFVEALSAAIAAKIAMQLTGDKELMKGMYALANGAVVQARASDGNEGLLVIDPEASWIAARTDQGYFGNGDGYWMAPYGPLYGFPAA